MNDCKLLELAAKAAGYKCEIHPLDPEPHRPAYWIGWNPLTDDGDCGRLEAKLNINIEWWSDSVCCTVNSGLSWTELFADHKDKNAARRYASAALTAEIGRTMK